MSKRSGEAGFCPWRKPHSPISQSAGSKIRPAQRCSYFSSSGYSPAPAAAAFGGFAPFASAYLIDLTGQKVAPADFLTICAALTLATLVPLKESFRKNISQSMG
jgi:hypothetical protein